MNLKNYYWINIWFNPRDTVKESYCKISKMSSRVLFILSRISIIMYFIYYGHILDVNGGNTKTILKVILLGVVWGTYSLLIDCRRIEKCGKKLGGQGSLEDIRKALALSQIPLIYGLIFHVLKIVIFNYLGIDLINDYDNSIFLSLMLLFCICLDAYILYKGYIIYLNCLSEIEKYPRNKGLILALKSNGFNCLDFIILFLYIRWFDWFF